MGLKSFHGFARGKKCRFNGDTRSREIFLGGVGCETSSAGGEEAGRRAGWKFETTLFAWGGANSDTAI